MFRSLLAAFALWLVPAAASAESAIVLVPEAGVSDRDLERARSAVIESLAERGIRLVRAPDGAECDAEDCAAELARTSGADFVALVLAEAADDGGARVRIVLARASGQAGEAVAPVRDAGFGAAAAAALDQALAIAPDPRLGFLLIRTRPPGAAVAIDGEAAGTTPLRRSVASGEHRVRITPEDGRAREHTVTVRPFEESVLAVDLAADEGEDGSTPAGTARRSEPSPMNWLVAGGLAIGGVLALVSPLQTLATEGQCVDRIENVGCVERVHFGPVSGVLIGVGVAALIGAVVVDVAAPIRVDVTVAAERATLGIEGRF